MLITNKKVDSKIVNALLLVCAFGATQNVVAASSKIPGDTNDYLRLGMPYHTSQQEPRYFDCIKGTLEETPMPNFISEQQMHTDQSFLSIKKLISGRVNGSANISGIKVNGSAWFEEQAAATTLDKNWVFSYVTEGSKVQLKPIVTTGKFGLTDTCSAYWVKYRYKQNGVWKVKPILENFVGDSFVTNVTYGASLYISVKASFRNKEDKTNFGGELNVEAGVIKVGGRLESTSEEFKKSVSITISALQLGGEPLKLAEVLPDSPSCTVNDIDSCQQILASALSYANTFPVQLRDSQGNVDMNRLNVIYYTVTPYKEAIGAAKLAVTRTLSTQLKNELIRAKGALELELDLRETALKEFQQAERKARPFVDSNFITTLRDNRLNVQKNLYLTIQLLQDCYENPYSALCYQQYDYARLANASCPGSTPNCATTWAKYLAVDDASKTIPAANILSFSVLGATADHAAQTFAITVQWSAENTALCTLAMGSQEIYIPERTGTRTFTVPFSSFSNAGMETTLRCEGSQGTISEGPIALNPQ